MSSLSDRLARLRALRSEAGSPEDGSGPPDSIPEPDDRSSAPPGAGSLPSPGAGPRPIPGLRESGEPPEGWQRISPYLWQRRIRFPDLLPETFPASLLLPRGCRREQLLFLDTETSGLSGGAGTMVFLVGIGRAEAGGFSVDQFFLADFPGEREFLEVLREHIPPDALCVTYNGKRFDLPLLRGRFAMQGIRFVHGPQADLLHVSRALWASVLGSCTLSNLEERVLGISREIDLPGREVPDRWFGFLGSGDAGPLVPVFEHNLQDVRTLLLLLDHLESCFDSPGRSRGVDRFRLGLMLSRAERPEAVAVLTDAWEAGDSRAGRFLAVLARRSGRWEDALAIWERMYGEGKSPFAGTELAKYHEHRAGDPETARRLVGDLLLRPLTSGVRKDLEHRLQRLERKVRKVQRLAGGGSGSVHRERG